MGLGGNLKLSVLTALLESDTENKTISNRLNIYSPWLNIRINSLH
jgi:hypothetical protein